MSTRIGCSDLHYALLTTEDTVTTAGTYETPVKAPGVMSININPNTSSETNFTDDGPSETASALGKIEVEINKNELTTAERAALLGHAVDGNGGIVYGADDKPPIVAIGFRAMKSSGKYKYVWLYKGRFSDMEDAHETQKDGVSFQTDTIKGSFVRVNNSITVDAKPRRPWRYDLDEDDSGVDAATIAGWFTAVTFAEADPVIP